MSNQLKNLLIGIFLISGIAVLVGFVMFLRPSVGDEKQLLYVRFSNINKVNVGTRVLFAGKPIGQVTKIEPIYHARETQPSDQLGRLYFYQLTLRIDSNAKVFSTDEISIQTSGLLGEKSIAIVPRSPPKGMEPERLTDKTPFYADSIDPIENTFSRLSDIGEKMEATIDLVKGWLEENKDHLAHAVTSFGSAMDQIDCAVSQVNTEQLIPTVKQGATHFSTSMQQVNDAMARLHRDGVFTNIGPLVSNFKAASASIDKISQDINSGSGTLGKLLNNEDLYLRLNAILSKADTTMNDINHYGILFHLNKGWQRVRTKRLSVLNALDTPSGFKTYFQSEMDQINTSMARLSMLIDKAQQDPESEKIIETPRFKQDFADLMRHIDEMSDNLRLYNEQLMNGLK